MTPQPAPPLPEGFTSPGTYRKKPVVVRAIRFTGENVEECIAFMGGRRQAKAEIGLLPGPGRGATKGLLISTLEGKMGARVGDWIIRGIRGEFYPCRPEIFADTYELVATR